MSTRAEDATFEGPHGPIPVRIYRPAGGDGSGAGFVWNHGGGWVGGDLDMAEAHGVAAGLAEDIDGVVVSVEYRLAPTHRFPVPVDDVAAAYSIVHDRADDLGIDRRRLGFGGASAGGHLAALAAVRLTTEGRTPRALVLVYPATDPVDGPYEKRPDDCPPEYWLGRTTASNLFASLVGEGDAPDDAVPARAKLDGLPPTLVTTAGIDGLTAQALRFVELLRAAGVDVEHHHEAWAYHGYLSLVGTSRRADAALARHGTWLREALA